MISQMLPHDKDSEEAVLGALLIDKSVIYQINPILKPAHFYHEAHQLIYEAAQELDKAGSPIDLITITDQLTKNKTLEKAGGAYELYGLTNKVGSSANVIYHSKIILEKWMRREAIRVGAEIQHQALSPSSDEFELLATAEQNIQRITDATLSATSKDNESIMMQLEGRMEKAAQGDMIGDELTGLHDLDKFIDGILPDDFIIIAGRPSMGKSSLFNSFTKYCVENAIPSLFWSLEMTALQQAARLLSALSGIPYSRMMRKDFASTQEDKAYEQARDLFIKSPVILEDRVGINALDFKSRVISLKNRKGLKMACLDRIGLLNDLPGTRKDSTSDKIGAQTKILRQVAMGHDVPVIAINQLNRDVEKRPLKIPMMSDLRSSGNLEQDATKIILIYRPEYYDIEEFEGMDTKGLAFLLIPKNRDGKVTQGDPVRIKFNAEMMYFGNYDNVYDGAPF